MYDGINFEVPTSQGMYWKENSLLNFRLITDKYQKFNGKYYVAEFNSMYFYIWIDDKNKIIKCECKGSVHKFYNKGKHNADDFTLSKFIEVLNILKSDFNICSHSAIIHGLEVGVNFELSITVKRLLKYLIGYKNKGIEPMRVGHRTKRKTVGKSVELQRKRIKVYSNYDKDYDVVTSKSVRFELVYNKMIGIEDDFKKLYKKGVIDEVFDFKTLNDLADVNKAKYLISGLLEFWNEIIFYDDSIDNRQLSKLNRNKLQDFKNPLYWSNQELKGVQRSRDKKAFKKLISDYGSNYQNELYYKIQKKYNKLLV